MSDETTPGPDLREQIASHLCQVWPTDIHFNAEGNADKIRGIADIVLAVVQAELDQLRERAESAESLAAAAMGTVGRLQGDERTTERLRQQQEARIRELHEEIDCECTKCVNRRENAWGCPDTICKECSDDDGASGAMVYPCPTIAALDQSDLPAVREFAANLDPRGEAT